MKLATEILVNNIIDFVKVNYKDAVNYANNLIKSTSPKDKFSLCDIKRDNFIYSFSSSDLENLDDDFILVGFSEEAEKEKKSLGLTNVTLNLDLVFSLKNNNIFEIALKKCSRFYIAIDKILSDYVKLGKYQDYMQGLKVLKHEFFKFESNDKFSKKDYIFIKKPTEILLTI